MCTTDRHDGSCPTCETDEWVDLTPIQRARLAAFNRGTREAAAEFAARITPTFKEKPMPADHREQAGSIADEESGVVKSAGSRPGYGTLHALLAIHDLLDERLPKPKPIEHVLNLDALKHQVETPPGEHGECCEPAPADDLPGEPVEPGDLRAGDRVEFTYRGERIACTLVSSPLGPALTSDTPRSSGYRPSIVNRSGEWCYGVSDVRLIERAPRGDEDPDEADDEDAKAMHATMDTHLHWDDLSNVEKDAIRSQAERMRQHFDIKDHLAAQEYSIRAERAEAEQDELRDACNSWQSAAQEAEYLSEKFRAERDGWKADAVARKRVVNNRGEQIASLTERNVDLTAERDEWKARHEALRGRIEERLGVEQRVRTGIALDVAASLAGLLDYDDARTPRPDPDTVTLRREDVAEVLEHLPADESCPQLDRVRAALGWGDEA